MRLALGALLTAAVIGLGYAGMWRGWRHRQARQSGLAPLPPVPDSLVRPPKAGRPYPPSADATDEADGVEGTYVATTTAGDWLDRIAVHDLGIRSPAEMIVAREGLVFRRTGAADVFIPADRLAAVRTDRAIAGKVAAGLLVVTWSHDGRELDTGFKPRHKADTGSLTTQIETLIGADR